MKVAFITDPHGGCAILKKVPQDVGAILLNGDLGKTGQFRKMIKSRKQISNAVYKKAMMEVYSTAKNFLQRASKIAPTYLIFGNHEFTTSYVRLVKMHRGIKLPNMETEFSKIKNVHIVNDQILLIGKSKIGAIQYFNDESWTRICTDDPIAILKSKLETKIATKILDKFRKVDILLSHQPPFGCCDVITDKIAGKYLYGKHAGSKAILAYIKKYQPKVVICGHIHEGKGVKKVGKTVVYNLGSPGIMVRAV